MIRIQVQQRLAVDLLLLHRPRIHARTISKIQAQSFHKRANIFNFDVDKCGMLRVRGLFPPPLRTTLEEGKDANLVLHKFIACPMVSLLAAISTATLTITVVTGLATAASTGLGRGLA